MADLFYSKLHYGDDVFVNGKLDTDGFVNINKLCKI